MYDTRISGLNFFATHETLVAHGESSGQCVAPKEENILSEQS